MSYITAARFESWDNAGEAARRLMQEGFSQEAIHTFYVNPAGAHAKFPTGGDQAADPDSSGGQAGAWGGGALLGVVGAVIGALIGTAAGGNVYVLIVATGLGAYLGSLAGALRVVGRGRKKAAGYSSPAGERGMAEDSDADKEHVAIRQSGVTLAVVLDPAQRDLVAGILKAAGGVDVERAVGSWEDGKWADFDPVKPPELEPANVGANPPVNPPASPAGQHSLP